MIWHQELAALRQLLLDAKILESQGLSHQKQVQEGKGASYRQQAIALPITIEQDKQLRSVGGSAWLMADPSAPGVHEMTMTLEAMRWKTHVKKNDTKYTAETFIANMAHEIQNKHGPVLFIFLGQVIAFGKSSYLCPQEQTFEATERRSLEMEIKTKCLSMDWVQAMLGPVRDLRSEPLIMILDGTHGIANHLDLPKHFEPAQRIHNSIIIRHEPAVRPMQHREGYDFNLLAMLHELIMEPKLSLLDLISTLRTHSCSTTGQELLFLDHLGVKHTFYFNPLPLMDRPLLPELQELRDITMMFQIPTNFGLPAPAVEGQQDLQPRLIKMASHVERVDCLDYIQTRFAAKHSTGTVVLMGPAGCGKSTIAAGLCRKMVQMQECTGVFWLKAQNLVELYYDCVGLATFLGLIESHERQMESILAQLRRWLRHNPGWLIVLDGVESETVVDLLDFPSERGMILLTSETVQWPQMDWQDTVELPWFQADEEARILVFHHLPEVQPAVSAAAIKFLNCRPLSLMLAVSFIKGEEADLKEYLEGLMLLRSRLIKSEIKTKRRNSLLASSETNTNEKGSESLTQTSPELAEDIGLYMIVQGLLESTRAIHPSLGEMLVIVSCIHNTTIPHEMFERKGDKKHIDVLVRYGVLHFQGGNNFCIHPSLQAEVRKQAAELPPVRKNEEGQFFRTSYLQDCFDTATELLDGCVGFDQDGEPCFRSDRAFWLVHAVEFKQHQGQLSQNLLFCCADELAFKLNEFELALQLLENLRDTISTPTRGGDNQTQTLAAAMVCALSPFCHSQALTSRLPGENGSRAP